MSEEEDKSKSKLSLREFFSIGDVGRYFFRSKGANKSANVNTRIMHGINRLAIVIFLAGAIYIVVKFYIL
jgi:hypothetical protein